MKSTKSFLSILASIILLTSCSSLVTLEDVRSQEKKARSAVEDAREETVELANIKEQYSEDRVKAKIKELEKEQKAVDKDIKSLKDITTESAVGSTEGTLKNLENQSKSIDKDIKKLKQEEAENWDEAIQRIEQDIESLNLEIGKITANLSQN